MGMSMTARGGMTDVEWELAMSERTRLYSHETARLLQRSRLIAHPLLRDVWH
jgi:hypothetical protein